MDDFVVKQPILIFPAGMPRALEFLDRVLGEGRDVIGASSLARDPSRERYPAWLYLPYITAPEFNDALKQVLADFNIGRIYTPNPVVWDCLNRVLKEFAPGISLVNSSPIDAELSSYRTEQQFGQFVIEQPICLASAYEAKPVMSPIEIAVGIEAFTHRNNHTRRYPKTEQVDPIKYEIALVAVNQAA